MAVFGVRGNDFVLDGRPVRLLSGALHYFRVVPPYWRDRLLKLKALGLNAVETYVPWNVHEPQEGTFRFDGMADVAAFIALAGELGLHVIVRPSPYICAEWEFGGLPAWLLADPGLKLRCSDPAFLRKVDAYYDVLMPILKPLQCTHGGPVVAMQIENEYGSYGNDRAYLEYVRDAMRKRGIDVLLFTSDGPEHHMLQGGSIDGELATVNFGSRAADAFAMLRAYRPEGPLMCMEFWNGWFDHWMEAHQRRPAADAAEALDELLRQGASVNLYMFHGGTNFGFMNGANHIERYEPTVGSYDYDAPLDESGQPTEKFYAFREVLARHVELPELRLSPPVPKTAYGEVRMDGYAGLFGQLSRLSRPLHSPVPLTMEQAGQAYGFILYSTFVSGPRSGMKLALQEVRDRALVFANGVCVGTVERWDPAELPLDVPAEGLKLDILVENMGRINYGPLLRDPKGITEGVRLGNAFLHGWTIRPLPLDSVDAIAFAALGARAEAEPAAGPAPGGASAPGAADAAAPGGASAPEAADAAAPGGASAPGAADAAAPGGASAPGAADAAAPGGEPTFYRGTFRVEEPADTFVRLDGWTKGCVYLNGFHLGRYWNRGPQRTLYVPAPLLRRGVNELVVFELHGTTRLAATLTDNADLG